MHRLHVDRAFCHYHYVGPVESAGRFAQSPVGENFVVEYRAVVFGQDDGYRRFDVAVLEGVVKDNHVEIGVDLSHLADAF